MRKTYRELKIAGPRHLLPEALNPSSWSPCLLPVFFSLLFSWMGFLGGPDGKESTCNAGDSGLIPGQEAPLEKGMTIHSSILAWRIPRTKEPSRLLSVGLQRVRHDWTTSTFHYIRKWPLLIFPLSLVAHVASPIKTKILCPVSRPFHLHSHFPSFARMHPHFHPALFSFYFPASIPAPPSLCPLATLT